MIDGTLVLAAGKSTRVRPISGGVPKPLLVVAGRPIICWNLRWLAGHGLKNVWINLHYEPAAVRDALGDGSACGVQIQYVHEPEILGTAGAWRNLADEWGETTLVVYGDNLLRFDLAAFADAHRRGGTLATVALFDPIRHPHTGMAGGRAVLDDRHRIVRFAEATGLPEGVPGLVNAGVYLLDRELLERLATGFSDFGRDVFPDLATTAELSGYVIEPAGYCLGLDTPESFSVAEALIQSHRVVLS